MKFRSLMAKNNAGGEYVQEQGDDAHLKQVVMLMQRGNENFKGFMIINKSDENITHNFLFHQFGDEPLNGATFKNMSNEEEVITITKHNRATITVPKRSAQFFVTPDILVPWFRELSIRGTLP